MVCTYKKRVSFHETDCMKVVHHSVYAKYFEDARVAFLFANKMEKYHAPYFDYTLALLSLEVKYIKPLRLYEAFEVHLQVSQISSTRFEFKYEIKKEEELVTLGKTIHVGLDKEFNVVPPPVGLSEIIKSLEVGYE